MTRGPMPSAPSVSVVTVCLDAAATLGRTLASVAAQTWPAVEHIVIDGAVDAPDILGKMLGPERFQALRQKKVLETDGLLVPAEVANTYYHLAHQHRSA